MDTATPSFSCTCDRSVPQSIFTPCRLHRPRMLSMSAHHQLESSIFSHPLSLGLPLTPAGPSIFDGHPLPTPNDDVSRRKRMKVPIRGDFVASSNPQDAQYKLPLSASLFVPRKPMDSTAAWASLPDGDPGRTFEPFAFLELLPEIRNEIYRLVLVKPWMMRVQPSRKRFLPLTALLCVSKQVHQESSSIFYQENTFLFPFYMLGHESMLQCWDYTCKILPNILMALKHIEIHILVSNS